MSAKTLDQNKSRRAFLKEIATVGGATALAAVSGGAVAAEVKTAKPAEQTKSRGYHVTPHIRTYYDKARSI